MKKSRWTILGTGKVARRFAAALNHLPEEAELLAVGSRNRDTAESFGREFGVPRLYTDYSEAVNDPDVDVVYIGTPGVFHKRDVALALSAGKAVLCEKAFAMNAREAEEMIALARERGLFLMEAVWTRFFPVFVKIRELIAAGAIGRLAGITANFCTTVPAEENNRFWDVNLGAGVVLDLGSYGVNLGSMLFGPARETAGLCVKGSTGADVAASFSLSYDGGQTAAVHCSQITSEAKEALIFGDRGKIIIRDPWYKPVEMILFRDGQEPEIFSFPPGEFNGYEYEIREVTACLDRGAVESSIMPLDETLSCMRTLDAIRAQCGIRYPGE